MSGLLVGFVHATVQVVSGQPGIGVGIMSK
jgi:hypothetical protein